MRGFFLAKITMQCVIFTLKQFLIFFKAYSISLYYRMYQEVLKIYVSKIFMLAKD